MIDENSKTEHKFKTEKEAEDYLIDTLKSQGYKYLKIRNEDGLKDNLREQLERLNNLQEIHKGKKFKFTDEEWEKFFKEEIANPSKGIIEKTNDIQNYYIKALKRDDGKNTTSVYLIDKKNIKNNHLQVINQYSEKQGNRNCRYDVTILVNGLPLVHIELKKENVPILNAFKQIKDYREDSFWAKSGLFEYIQIFIISNIKKTKYFSNSVKYEKNNGNSYGFEFTNYWSNENNEKIEDLEGFTKTFLSVENILNILTKYCVFKTNKELIVLRPYQIFAVKSIIDRIKESIRLGREGTKEAGGYIWHATGSGKTLTTFKAAELASKINGIEKILIVLDRSELINQTEEEYQKFSKDLTAFTSNTEMLIEKLQNISSEKIIVTSIKKLNKACSQRRDLAIFNKRVVLIFDECHRSQFGEMHKKIIQTFKKRLLFGFTGTPIFKENSLDPNYKTTEHYFGEKLSAYTLLNAIIDENVLKFLVTYIEIKSEKRIERIVDYVIDEFHAKTKGKRFNSILAANSIEEAIQYYDTFKAKLKKQSNLKITTIFSPEEKHNHHLERIIKDYNKDFEVDYDLSKYGALKRDISKRIKERKIDLLIVDDMFLTGFDSPTLNTLWLDKPKIKYHKLIQAFSRTNRIYNKIKDFGFIIDFNNIEEQVKQSLKLFGYNDKQIEEILALDYEKQYQMHEKDVKNLRLKFPVDKDNLNQEEVKDFLIIWNQISVQLNSLNSFSKFKEERILTKDEEDHYWAKYQDYYEWKKQEKKNQKTGKNLSKYDEIIESIPQTGLEIKKEEKIDFQYFLKLYQDGIDIEKIIKSMAASPEHRNKRDRFRIFCQDSNNKISTYEKWEKFEKEAKIKEIKELVKIYRLRNEHEIIEAVNEENLEKINKGPWIGERIIPKMSIDDKNRFKTIQIVRRRLIQIINNYSKKHGF